MAGSAILEWIEPTLVGPLDGSEEFIGVGTTVMDFWRWTLSDLRMNTTRSLLAEFLVAKAVGDPSPLRVEWADFDVTSAEGIKIEVKSSRYCQSWRQRRLSTLSFGRLSARAWSEETGARGAVPDVRADVFVFAIQTCRDCQRYDAFDLNQWEFRVIPGAVVKRHAGRSVGLSFVLKQAPDPLRWDQLHEAVRQAAMTGGSTPGGGHG